MRTLSRAFRIASSRRFALAVAFAAMATATPSPSIAGGTTAPSLCGTCGGNSAPKVSLTSPTNNAKGAAPATFSLAATASGSATIAYVAFLANGVEVDSDSTYPYTGTFTTSTPGTYALTATATDVNDFITTSSSRTVTVTNAMPGVTLTSPATGSSTASPGTLTLSANASDSDGSIVRVDFRSNGVVVCKDVSAPFKCIYSGLGPGSYAVSAVATDNIGGAATSSTATVTVTGVVPGRVSETRMYSYDNYQMLCKRFNPESGATTVEYDSAGNVRRTIDSFYNNPTGCSVDGWDHPPIERSYDALNRLIRTTTPWAVADPPTDIIQDYYPDGAVRSVSSRNSGNAWVTTNYTYNLRGLLTSETSINGGVQNTLGYGYSNDGLQSAVSYPDGQVVLSYPDGLGRSQKVWSAAGVVYANDITYWPGGAIKGFTYGNGITHRMDQNARGLPARSYDLGSTARVLDDRYDYDDNGNVVDITDAAQNGLTTRGMGYDGLDRLTAVVSPGQWGTAVYSYDALDNITRADVGTRQYRYAYNPTTWRLDTIKSPAGATLFSMQYDSTGNQVKKNNQSYVFDLTNRLVSVVGLQSYRYDGSGRRVQATDAGDKSTYWIYSQAGQLLFTSEARRNQNLSYVYLGNTLVATRSVAWGSGTIAIRYQHTDALGSPVAESDSFGAILKRNSFEPYGSPWNGPWIDGAGYAGHVMDRDTGLTYMQQRYYDSSIGRFLSVDPVATDSSSGFNFNRVNYAGNSPFKFKDPDGRFIDVALDAAFIAYDIYSLANDPSWTGAAALGLDVVGAAIPFVTGLGQAYRAADKLVDVARKSEAAVAKTGRASTDGIAIHGKFDQALGAGAVKGVTGETAYRNGQVVDAYRPKGSSNPDAILGNLNKPVAAFDLKTGVSGISNAQAAKAAKNLPSGTPMYEIRPSGHNVPAPSRSWGAGAATNVACAINEGCL